MFSSRFSSLALLGIAFWLTPCPVNAAPQDASGQRPTRFVPFSQVEMNDRIWRPRIRRLVRNTLPHAFQNTEVAQERLRQCAEWLESGGATPKPEPHRFNTSDLYKVMEGAARMIQAEPNESIEQMMDQIIDVIARAQADDGYLYVPHITGSIRANVMGERPYSYVVHSHELYNVGHLYEAAIAYARATGKTKLLEVAEKNARHIQRVFFEGDPDYNDGEPVRQAPGHQEIEIGLLKLYDYTGKRLYLEMAKRFLDIRGVTYRPDGTGVNSPEYAQQHAPVAEQTDATGHAVRATYQYSAMAEVDSLLGTTDFSDALQSIWHDIVDTKMHITGGLGAVPGIEGFGPSYRLPNKETYLETCAAVGNVFFNTRMFLKYRDAKYIDVAEVALLNNCLAGMGAEGTSFFYPNPLEADWGHAPRSDWFGTACCPSNLARLIPQVSGYMYATDERGIYCTLHGENSARLVVDGMEVRLSQQTNYPWSGNIQLKIDPREPHRFAVRMRIPTWAGKKFVPGELYSFVQDSPSWSLALNGEAIEDVQLENGFAVVERKWKAGDELELRLPMPLKVNRCIERVEANRDRVCFTRGPIVMCAEGIDNGGAVQRFFVNVDEIRPDRIALQPIEEGKLAGIPRIEIPARQIDLDRQPSAARLNLIPYFAWSNRDRSSMQVWFPTRAEMAEPDLMSPQNLKFQSVEASHTFRNDTVEAVRMRHSPESSSDTSIPRWTSWPQRGQDQWLEITLDQPTKIRSVGVYFYDDGGGVQVPASWKLQSASDDGWQDIEIYNTDSYSTLADQYNTVRPSGNWVADKLRIVMTPQHDGTCVGVLSVEVEANP